MNARLDADVVLGRAAVPLVLAAARREADGDEQVLRRWSPWTSCDHVSSAAQVAVSNSGVFGITPSALTRPCQVSPRGPLVSPCAGRPGAMPSTWAVERRVVAVRELGAEADAGDVLGQAHAEQVDVVGVDQVVLAVLFGPTLVRRSAAACRRSCGSRSPACRRATAGLQRADRPHSPCCGGSDGAPRCAKPSAAREELAVRAVERRSRPGRGRCRPRDSAPPPTRAGTGRRPTACRSPAPAPTAGSAAGTAPWLRCPASRSPSAGRAGSARRRRCAGCRRGSSDSPQ